MSKSAEKESNVAESHCPRCGAVLVSGQSEARCWLCRSKQEEGDRRATADVPSPQWSWRADQFSLSSLMMFVTLVAVVCGASTIAPGLGILLAIVATLAFVRTVILVHRESAVGHHPSAIERVVLFAGSTGIVIVAGLATVIALFVTCLGMFVPVHEAVQTMTGGDFDAGNYAGVVAGSVFGGMVGVYLGYRVYFWLSKSKPRLSHLGKLILAGAMILAIIASLLFGLFTLWNEYPP